MEVAELYRQQGRTLTKGGAIRVAQYTRARFYKQKQRWKRVAPASLNSPVTTENGYEVELSEIIPDRSGLDLETWIDFKDFYKSRPQREKKAIAKMLKKESWHNLAGNDWRLIKSFRDAYRTA